MTTNRVSHLVVRHDAEGYAVDLGQAMRKEDVEPVVREVQRLAGLEIMNPVEAREKSDGIIQIA